MTEYVVSSGVTSSGLTLLSGDTMRVLAGGSAVRITANSGSDIFDDGTTNSITLNSGIEDVQGGGSAILTTVNSGGVENVLFDGLTSNTTVNSLGVEDVRDGGVTSYTTINSGGTENVDGGGRSINTTILSGGVEDILRGGLASVTLVQAGGLEEVQDGGITSATTVSGTEDIFGGGIARATTVFAGGTETVGGSISAGLGYTTDTVVSSGGTENVLSGGIAQGTILNSGATMDVTGGVAENVVTNAGADVVMNGGALVYTGSADQTQSFNGTLTGSGSIGEFGPSTLVLNGNLSGFTGLVGVTDGTVELTSATAAGDAAIKFGRAVAPTNAGTLQIDGTTTPDNTISGFAVGDKIDLRNLDITSASLGANNVLTLTVSGGGTEALNFNPNQDFAGERFVLSPDGHGGTDVSLEREGLAGGHAPKPFENILAEAEQTALTDITKLGGLQPLGGVGGTYSSLDLFRPAGSDPGLFADLSKGDHGIGLPGLGGHS